MATTLDILLRDLETDVLARWEQRVRRLGLSYASRPSDEIHHTHREALRGVVVALGGGDEQAAVPYVLQLSRTTLPAGLRDLSQSETVTALLLGRDVIRELLLERLSQAEAAPALRELTEAFQRVISLYGTTSCSLCLSRQEESRHAVERRLETVIENSTDAILLCDEHGRVESWNRGAEALFGHPAEEVRHRTIEFLIPEGRRQGNELSAMLAALRQQGHARREEWELRTRSGDPVWVDASFSLIKDAEGNALGVWGVFRDITERKRLEEEHLQAERLALVGTMSARFAHEIRNPLASILLNLEIIRDGLKQREAAGGHSDPEDDEVVTSIASEVSRIQNVVQEYLRFARLPKGKRSPLDLDALLRRHIALLAPELASRHVELVLDLQAGSAQVLGDEDQLWQVVLNLVRNSMEAMPNGGRIEIATRRDGDRVRCIVADHGPGIPIEVQERMFVPFYSTKRSGTGLGLPYVKQILQEHGAPVACDSAPGQGTRFTFSLPAAASHGA